MRVTPYRLVRGYSTNYIVTAGDKITEIIEMFKDKFRGIQNIIEMLKLLKPILTNSLIHTSLIMTLIGAIIPQISKK